MLFSNFLAEITATVTAVRWRGRSNVSISEDFNFENVKSKFSILFGRVMTNIWKA
jgi:hypothetical protein